MIHQLSSHQNSFQGIHVVIRHVSCIYSHTNLIKRLHCETLVLSLHHQVPLATADSRKLNVSGQLHALAILPPTKQPIVPIV
jgi:hypothetical protein